MSKPIAVVTGDIHFTVSTLELATSAVSQAKNKAKQLGVPLVLNGDTLDGKALIRGECANRLIELLDDPEVKIIINCGNHDLISERGKPHVLNFLRPYADVVQAPVFYSSLNAWILPYHSDSTELQIVLNGIPKGSTLIIHQGVQTAFLGHYVQDKSSLPKEAYADFRVVASHYHRAQSIKCGRPRKGAVGLFSYIGTPYTTSFSEAADGPKGFKVLYDDGLLELVPTNLRKHVILMRTFENVYEPDFDLRTGDLLWLKVSGTYQELESLNKHKIGMALLGHSNYKLEKIHTDAAKTEVETEKYTGEELMDKLIDNTVESIDNKAALKMLWRELV